MTTEIVPGKGLLITVMKEIPSILNWGDQVIEIYRGNDIRGQATIQIKAPTEIGITGAHLLQKMIWEREKLQLKIKELEDQNEFLINQRIESKSKLDEESSY